MLKLILILLVALFFEAVGVVLLSKGLKEIGEMQGISASEIWRMVKTGASNHSILLGVFFEAIFFAGLLILMSRSDVSLIWPLTSLGFVFAALAAKYFLHETVSRLRWGGIGLIVLGAALISYSEKQEEARKAAAKAHKVMAPAGELK